MEIRHARHGRHVAIVTIDNQPRLNAMTRAMLAELGRLWDELQCDESCRAIVLHAPAGIPSRCRRGIPVRAAEAHRRWPPARKRPKAFVAALWSGPDCSYGGDFSAGNG